MATLLAHRLGTSTFKTWLAQSFLKEETSEYPTLCFENKFKADWVYQHFNQTIEATAKEVMPQMKYIHFTV